MSSSDRGGAIARRNARVAEHIRQGKTSGEICDVEGLDPANEPKRMKKDVADPAGLTITAGRNTALPLGLMDIERQFRVNLKTKLNELRDHNHYIDVAHMVGMTNVEQHRAVTSPFTHNWTLSQMQRLAAALGLTFEEVLHFCLTNGPPVDFRKKK